MIKIVLVVKRGQGMLECYAVMREFNRPIKNFDNMDIEILENSNYFCGLFWFTKK